MLSLTDSLTELIGFIVLSDVISGFAYLGNLSNSALLRFTKTVLFAGSIF